MCSFSQFVNLTTENKKKTVKNIKKNSNTPRKKKRTQQRFSEKRSGAFGQYENGAQQITRQVSNRIQKGPIIGKRLAKESWHGAADKVRVILSRLFVSVFHLIFNSFLPSLLLSLFLWMFFHSILLYFLSITAPMMLYTPLRVFFTFQRKRYFKVRLTKTDSSERCKVNKRFFEQNKILKFSVAKILKFFL